MAATQTQKNTATVTLVTSESASEDVPDKRPYVSRGNFERLKQKVFQKKPVLKEIIEKHGNLSLYEYAKRYLNVHKNPPDKKRQEEFIGVFQKEAEAHFGRQIAQETASQLKKYYFVSTADHHGPISHPWFTNPHLAVSAVYAEQNDADLKNIIVLACSNVSLNNFSFPRGLLFHSSANGEMELRRLSFLPSNSHTSSIYNFRPYKPRDIKKLKELLEGTDLLINLLDEIYNQPDLFECKYFSDQITKTNYSLWKKFFKSSSPTPPNLIYLDQERLVSRLLIEHHFWNDTVINRIIFNPAYAELIHGYFEGLDGCFSHANKKGSYLFWAFPKGKTYRVRLLKQGNFLVSEDLSYSIPLSPDALKNALESKELMPTTMLNFIVLSFYYGVMCLGGPGQVNYLTTMKDAYIKMQPACEKPPTNELCCDFNLAFLSDKNGSFVPATGLDLILYGTSNTWPELIELSKRITLEDSLNPEMPQYYESAYPRGDREPELAILNHEDVVKLTGLNQKIQPIVYI